MNKATVFSFCQILTLLLLASTLQAQDVGRIVKILKDSPAEATSDEKKAKKTTDPVSAPIVRSAAKLLPIFSLRDRSKVAGMPKIEALAVQTRYGILNIPRKELIRVRLVERVDPGIKRNVTKLLAQLGDDDFEVRENTMDALRDIGLPALPLIREATKSSNEEVKNRAEILVDELEELRAERAGADSSPGLEGSDDEITTNRMTIKGQVLAEAFVIASRYGELTIDVADIKSISFRKAGPTSQKFDILPKFQPPGNWFDTKFNIEKGQKFRLEANGTITVTNYSVSCNPTGTRNWGGNNWNNFAQLALVGKLGKKGKPFLVGTQYRGIAKKEGRLYLSIVPFSYNPTGAVGKYTAKVRLLGGE